MTTKFGAKKETLLYHTVLKVFRYLEPFKRESRVWRTDRHYNRKCRAYQRCARTKKSACVDHSSKVRYTINNELNHWHVLLVCVRWL